MSLLSLAVVLVLSCSARCEFICLVLCVLEAGKEAPDLWFDVMNPSSVSNYDSILSIQVLYPTTIRYCHANSVPPNDRWHVIVEGLYVFGGMQCMSVQWAFMRADPDLFNGIEERIRLWQGGGQRGREASDEEHLCTECVHLTFSRFVTSGKPGQDSCCFCRGHTRVLVELLTRDM